MQSCGAPPPPDAAAASVKVCHYCSSMIGAQYHPSTKRQEPYSFDLVSPLSGWLSLSLSLSSVSLSLTLSATRLADRQSICTCLSSHIENILRKRGEFMRKLPFEQDGYTPAFLCPKSNL